MRVAKWLTGLLYQLSLFITRSWEVHFHPRQGKVTAGRLQQRGGARARVGRADGGGGSGSARWGTLAQPGLSGLRDQPAPSIPGGCGCAVFRGIARGAHVSLRGPRGGDAWSRVARAPAGHELAAAGGRRGAREGGAAEGPECQGPCLGRVERIGVVGKQAGTLAERTCVCVRARSPACVLSSRPAGGMGTWGLGSLAGTFG